MATFNPSIITFTAILAVCHLTMTVGDALEFPRKGYRFPLKRNAPSDGGFAESFEDLVPMAQSYFITPETPSTTTIKTTFKRRTTLQPITSWGGEDKNKKRQNIIPAEVDTSTNNYNAFRQIVDTGFQPKKSFSSKKRRPSSIDMMRRDQNANEGGASINIESTTTIRTNNYETEQEGGNANAHKKFGGRRNSKKVVDYAGVSSSSAVASSPKPHRFTGQRRSFVPKNNADEAQVPTSESPIPVSTPSSSPRGTFSRSGRQFGRAPKTDTVEKAEILPQFASADNKPLRRRKKFTTTTSTSINGNDVDQVGAGSAPALDPELRRINSNVFASRRPISLGQIANAATLNPVENIQVQQDNAPLNRRMRHRPSQRTLLTPLVPDSDHESSSDAITILADSGDDQGQNSPAVGVDDSSTADKVVSDSLSRNLSNRKPTSLDKLTNRQAASRRFLTPKKNLDETGALPSTTKAPAFQTTPRTPRKSPLNLANLRNRRLGGSSSTTTTEAPVVSDADPDSHEVLGNLDVLDGAVVTTGNEGKNNTETGNQNENLKEDRDAEEKAVEEESKSPPLSGLLRNRRPPLRRPLPGARVGDLSSSPGNIPIKPRGPLKPKPQLTTTEKPQNVETTTPPTCEDGKRYNKILRKCIPAFKAG